MPSESINIKKLLIPKIAAIELTFAIGKMPNLFADITPKKKKAKMKLIGVFLRNISCSRSTNIRKKLEDTSKKSIINAMPIMFRKVLPAIFSLMSIMSIDGNLASSLYMNITNITLIKHSTRLFIHALLDVFFIISVGVFAIILLSITITISEIASNVLIFAILFIITSFPIFDLCGLL